MVLLNDGSREVMLPFENLPCIQVIHHKVNRGYGGALKSGLFAVETPYAVTIDGDGQHSLDDIRPIFDFCLKNDNDLVVGDRGRGESSIIFRELVKAIVSPLNNY